MYASLAIHIADTISSLAKGDKGVDVEVTWHFKDDTTKTESFLPTITVTSIDPFILVSRYFSHGKITGNSVTPFKVIDGALSSGLMQLSQLQPSLERRRSIWDGWSRGEFVCGLSFMVILYNSCFKYSMFPGIQVGTISRWCGPAELHVV
ncbi:predicted protein [Sclerotinia sclerotiorum 1980 UF-70]|uniref:Uncharacterized protein n=1 Tax=Sclerotinia sclerotiorum (strain ATCC 18683 / 1980 / Ss-1) TaxID=665079 RepID=A7F5J1_SCLS1|nr:predicted protein [Sclerotinia sclerotiorum 1980 UF-70]EDN98012.1 predicted protein [Sclerotinia sclerotiorum 1980 UF-70]